MTTRRVTAAISLSQVSPGDGERSMSPGEKWDSGGEGGGRWPPVMSSSLEERGSGKPLLCKLLSMDPSRRYHYSNSPIKTSCVFNTLYVCKHFLLLNPHRDHFARYPMNIRRKCRVSDVRTLSSEFTTPRGRARSWRPPRGWRTPSSSATGPVMWPLSKLSRIK